MSLDKTYYRTTKAEYIWLDGNNTQEIRSKTRILELENNVENISYFPEWSFDGSSTNQAEGHDSDCGLKPVYFTADPIRGEGNYIVLCEVTNADGSDHSTNKRAELRKALDDGGNSHNPYIGFEQEYTFLKEGQPLGWPKNGYPAPQGPFYCGAGATKVFGREIVEKHLVACEQAGLNIYGINAEVMPGQWEFQLGYRGFENEETSPLTISDQMWVARYLLNRIAEDHDVVVSYDNKPMKGDWNGAGMHTNFSTNDTRNPSRGKEAIQNAIDNLRENHSKHIEVYGEGLADRLTGAHETCSIKEFKSGVSHRGASIRIPLTTAKKGYGYFEDRRPGANSDPYLVSARLIESVCL